MAKSDEEYHFSEPETPVSYTADSGSGRKDKDFQAHTRRRNLIFMFAILMIFWAIYKFMGLLFSHVKETGQKQAVHRPIPPKVQPIQASVSASQLQEISSQKGRLNALESQMVSLQTTLSDMNTKLNDLSTQVSNLASQVNKPTPPPIAASKKWRPRKYTAGRRAHRPHATDLYQLQAALPGRAWIMRADGVTFTVSLGDRIPGYGTVISIEPDTGVVQMSSGATIKYIS